MAAARSFSSAALGSLVSSLVAAPVVAPVVAPLPVPTFVRAAGRVSVSAPVRIESAEVIGGRVHLYLCDGSSPVVLVPSYASRARGFAVDAVKVAAYLNRLYGRVVRLHTALGYTSDNSDGRGKWFAAISE